MDNEKSIKFVLDRGILWVRGINERSPVSGDIQQKVCIFCFQMESLTTESNVQLRSPEARHVQGRSDFRQGFLRY